MENIFHIGYHKTATTWFQKNFYPFIDNINYVEREKIKDFFYFKKNIDFSSENTLVFCDEELSGNIHNNGLSEFLSIYVANKISKFKNPKIILFLRNQYDIIISSYLQYIKEGGTYSIDKYIHHKDFDKSFRSPLFSLDHFDYQKRISFYTDLLGVDNVYIYLYEDFVEDPKKFIEKFIKDHNFLIDINKINFSKNNTSYSYISYFLARFTNRFTRNNVLYKHYFFHIPFFYEYSRELYSRINFLKINKNKFLNSNLNSLIKSYYIESNNTINDKYKLNLDRFNYPL